MGVDVIDIGLISTDMLYFAVANYGFDGGITVTASHNSGEYNGMKLVRENARPISIDTGIAEIREIAFSAVFDDSNQPGTVETLSILDDYIDKMISFVDKEKVRPLSVVVNPNFGASGAAIQRIADYFGVTMTKVNFEPDGHFPKGKPDPLQPANREETEALIKSGSYNFGATWDADADRCFFYDEKGNFIQPYYITGLLIEYFLKKNPGAKILTDPRLRWLPRDLIASFGGEHIISKSGHSFIKERMREDDVLFGAETSAHYYFKDLWYTDNGMVPFIIMLQILSESNKSLSELVSGFQKKYFAIPEMNFTVSSLVDNIARIKEHYSNGKTDEIDGFSCEYPNWRFNVRGSNTEPLLRLNLEAKNQKIAEVELEKLRRLINGE